MSDRGPVSAIHNALCTIREGHGQCDWPTDESRTVYDAAAAVLASDWLVEHDRRVRAEAWDEGATATADAVIDAVGYNPGSWPKNPYLQEGSHP